MAAATRELVSLRCSIAIHAAPRLRARIDRAAVRRAVRAAVEGRGFREVRIAVRLMDDAAIAELNERYLGHCGATDVITFPMDVERAVLEGDIAVSVETADREAAHRRHSAEHELLLYIIHGVLHLAGFDDRSPGAARRMRAEEQRVLRDLGLGDLFGAPALPRGRERNGN